MPLEKLHRFVSLQWSSQNFGNKFSTEISPRWGFPLFDCQRSSGGGNNSRASLSGNGIGFVSHIEGARRCLFPGRRCQASGRRVWMRSEVAHSDSIVRGCSSGGSWVCGVSALFCVRIFLPRVVNGAGGEKRQGSRFSRKAFRLMSL